MARSSEAEGRSTTDSWKKAAFWSVLIRAVTPPRTVADPHARVPSCPPPPILPKKPHERGLIRLPRAVYPSWAGHQGVLGVSTRGMVTPARASSNEKPSVSRELRCAVEKEEKGFMSRRKRV